jgi:hypothetical protein
MDEISPLLRAKAYNELSVFEPANLLREGRRQRRRPDVPVPAVCLLDPDGDIVRHLNATGQATEHPGWACYHTTLWTFDLTAPRSVSSAAPSEHRSQCSSPNNSPCPAATY